MIRIGHMIPWAKNGPMKLLQRYAIRHMVIREYVQFGGILIDGSVHDFETMFILFRLSFKILNICMCF